MSYHEGRGVHPHALDPYSPAVCAPTTRFAIDRVFTPSERHRMISKTAYLIAERRGFSPGHELIDWLAAEREVNSACGVPCAPR
jgi:hypothetical protein